MAVTKGLRVYVVPYQEGVLHSIANAAFAFLVPFVDHVVWVEFVQEVLKSLCLNERILELEQLLDVVKQRWELNLCFTLNLLVVKLRENAIRVDLLGIRVFHLLDFRPHFDLINFISEKLMGFHRIWLNIILLITLSLIDDRHICWIRRL